MGLRSCVQPAWIIRKCWTLSGIRWRHLFSAVQPWLPLRNITACTSRDRLLPNPEFISGKHFLQTRSHRGNGSTSDLWNSPEHFSDGGPIQAAETFKDGARHSPVMVTQVLELLNPKKGKLFIDMTFGSGGHTKAILSENPDAQVICLDRDPLAYCYAQELAKSYREGQVLACLGKFSEVPQILYQLGIIPGSVDGILFDVGASSMQYDQRGRGFSVSQDDPLDMRMDQGRDPDGVTAMDVVNFLSVQELREIIKKYGEDRMAKDIAYAVVDARYVTGKITMTQQLAEIIENVFKGKLLRDKLNRKSHVATRTFQALRIFVNNELNEINNGLEVSYHYLRPGGVCAGISFHSLEDRIFKRHFHGIDMDEAKNMSSKQKSRMLRDHHQKYDKELIESILRRKWIPASRKVITPDVMEVQENPRSRSAKLRAAIKSADV